MKRGGGSGVVGVVSSIWSVVYHTGVCERMGKCFSNAFTRQKHGINTLYTYRFAGLLNQLQGCVFSNSENVVDLSLTLVLKEKRSLFWDWLNTNMRNCLKIFS